MIVSIALCGEDFREKGTTRKIGASGNGFMQKEERWFIS